jgi:hypothetical protein
MSIEGVIGGILGGMSEMVKLQDENAALRAELASVREDAERWRYARTVLADDDIKRAVRECGKGHQPHEEENRLTDAAIDAARKGESDAE